MPDELLAFLVVYGAFGSVLFVEWMIARGEA